MLRVTKVVQTSWWKCFVDGTNPEDHGRQLVSRFFRSNKIDPYKLEHAMINDYKRWLLLEVGEKGGPKAVQQSMERLAHQRRFELLKLKRECPLVNS
jgi:hypothetical protein